MGLTDEKRAYDFLNFHYRVVQSTKMPYLRDLVGLDFIKDTFNLNYENAEKFIGELLDEEFLEYDQHGAFPGTCITSKGEKFMRDYEAKRKGAGESTSQSDEPLHPRENKPLQMHIWGKVQDANSVRPKINVGEDVIYRFLKFHIGVMARTGVPYLREMVAEDFLMDMEKMSYKQAAELIEGLLDENILEYDQFGAFPGTGVSEVGKQYFSHLKRRFE